MAAVLRSKAGTLLATVVVAAVVIVAFFVSTSALPSQNTIATGQSSTTTPALTTGITELTTFSSTGSSTSYTPTLSSTTFSTVSSSTTSLSTISSTSLTTSSTTRSSTTTSTSSSTTSKTSSTTTRTTSTTTTSTTSKTFNSTNYIVIPYGVGDNESLNFEPASLTVVVGVNNTIVWNDQDAEQHTVTSMSVPAGASKFDSGILNQGQTFTLTLTVPGTYKYYCTIHPTWMRGTIVVKP